MYRYLPLLMLVVCGHAYPDVDVTITTNEWWDKYPTSRPSVLSISAADPWMGSGYFAPLTDSEFSFWTDNGTIQHVWTYKGRSCLYAYELSDPTSSIEFIISKATHSSRPSTTPGVVIVGGGGHIVECNKPRNRMFIHFDVKPKPQKPPAPLSCRLDAAPAIDIVAPSGHTRRPVAAAVVCTGEGLASAVVRTTSPRSVVVTEGVSVVLNGQLDESISVRGGSSFPIDLHVDVENNLGAAGGYSVSYVLTVDLT